MTNFDENTALFDVIPCNGLIDTRFAPFPGTAMSSKKNAEFLFSPPPLPIQQLERFLDSKFCNGEILRVFWVLNIFAREVLNFFSRSFRIDHFSVLGICFVCLFIQVYSAVSIAQGPRRGRGLQRKPIKRKHRKKAKKNLNKEKITAIILIVMTKFY